MQKDNVKCHCFCFLDSEWLGQNGSTSSKMALRARIAASSRHTKELHDNKVTTRL